MRILSYEDNDSFFQAHAVAIEEREGVPQETEALSRSATNQFEQYIKLNKKIPPEVIVSLNQIEEPGKLADFLVIDGDPLERIADTARIDAVVVGGIWHDRSTLLQPPTAGTVN